jgi:APA family basic amino acid/polyamine antiporter
VPAAWFVCTAGVLSCLALLYFMAWFNWLLMIAWTVIGLCIYFGYGRRHSRLRRAS